MWTLNFGPQHPATHTTLRIVMKLDGERVVDDTFLLCFNAHRNPVDLVAPDASYAAHWVGALDTADPTGACDHSLSAGDTTSLPGRSVLVLRKTA